MDIYELIGNIELFRPVLDGFFKDWKGTYDIILKSGEYVFHPKMGACQFCEVLRKHPEGEALCQKCDQDHAREAASEGHVIVYMCHAGLIDIASPILVNGECLATVLCGQGRPEGKDNLKDAFVKVTNLEKKLGIKLFDLWLETESIPKTQLDSIKTKLTNLTKYLSEKWKQEIRLERAEKDLALRVKENEAIRIAFTGLSEIFDAEVAFWDALDKVILEICNQFEAIYGVVLVMNELNGIPTLQIKVNLPEHFLKRSYPGDQDLFQKVLRNKESVVIDFDYSVANTLCYDIADWLTSDNYDGHPDEMTLWPLYFSEEYYGVLCLFTKNEKEKLNSLSIKEERFILEPFLGQIVSAYKNYKLIQREREYSDLQSVWLQNVIHEVEQPINGILGYAELWNDDLIPILEDWPDSKETLTYDIVTSLHNGLESILWMTLNASQVARNFAWLAYETKEIDLSIENDLSGTLIACARDKQGQAKEKGIAGPNVVVDTIKPFDGHVQINKDLFKQAMRNLVDNAVKYASIGTIVTIDAVQQDSYLIIRVTNFGIPILPGEEENIFIRRKRSGTAENSNIGGAGIGLTIARDIMIKHKGNIRTHPSQSVRIKGLEHHKTVFEVMLPLLNT